MMQQNPLLPSTLIGYVAASENFPQTFPEKSLSSMLAERSIYSTIVTHSHSFPLEILRPLLAQINIFVYLYISSSLIIKIVFYAL